MSTQVQHQTGKRLVVGVDGSASGQTAVRFAAQEAHDRGVRLDIVHVVPADVPVMALPRFPDGSLQAFGTSVVEQAAAIARETCADLELTTHLVSGARIGRLLEASHGAELLVLGNRRVSTMEQLWTGDTCAGVTSQASTPVLVVPSSWTQPVAQHRVVVGYKAAPHSRELLGAAFAEAQRRSADLRVVHAWKLPGTYDDIISARVDDQTWNRAERARIDLELADWRTEYPDVTVAVDVVHDYPTRGLVTASRSADLLVVSRPAHGGHLHHLGSTVRGVLRLAECPVHVVPPAATPRRPSGPSPDLGHSDPELTLGPS